MAEGVPQDPNLQPAQQQAAAGWDPALLMALGKTFIDDKKTPIETVEDPAEKFRFERERASSPHGVDSPTESEPN